MDKQIHRFLEQNNMFHSEFSISERLAYFSLCEEA